MDKSIFIKIILLIAVLLSSCTMIEDRLAPTIKSNVQQTISQFTEVPSQTPYSTLTAFPTYTKYPTYTPITTYTPKIVIVTATSTKTPQYTSTITNTPTETLMPSPTLDPTQKDKGPGFYLVGEDISPGVWRSQGDSNSCYWSVTTKTGSIIKNHYGMAGGTLYIPSSGYQVELGEDCGNWTYLGD